MIIVIAVSVLVVPTFIPNQLNNQFAVITSHFDGLVDINDSAPASVLQYLSVTAANYFSTCTFTDKIKYDDVNFKQHFFGVYEREITPFTTFSLITTQTNNQIKNFLVDIYVTCPITSSSSTFSGIKAVADSGTTQLDIYAAKPDGTMSKVYSVTNALDINGKDLSATQKVFSFIIPASDIESKLSHQASAYASSIRVKPITTLQLHYTGHSGIETTKWTVGGQSESNLKITVQDDQFQCILLCLVSNKQIVVKQIPSDGQVPLSSPRISFTVILPEWSSDQGTPSYKIIDASTGVTQIQSAQLAMVKSGNDGTVTKSLLLPENAGRYDLIVTKQGRDTAVVSYNVYKTATVPPKGGELPGQAQTCPEGYKFIDNDCFLINSHGEPGSSTPSTPSDTEKAVEGWFACVSSQDSSCHWNYFGYYFIIGIIFLIVIIIKASGSSKPRY